MPKPRRSLAMPLVGSSAFNAANKENSELGNKGGKRCRVPPKVLNQVQQPVTVAATDSPQKKKPRKYYKRCFVPNCGSSARHQGKLFFCVSSVIAVRQEIFNRISHAKGLHFDIPNKKRPLYICSDHYHPETDFEEDKKYKDVTGEPIMRPKNGVLPELLLRTKHNGQVVWRRYDYPDVFSTEPNRRLPTTRAPMIDKGWEAELELIRQKKADAEVEEAAHQNRLQARQLFVDEVESRSQCSDSCGVNSLCGSVESLEEQGSDSTYEPSTTDASESTFGQRPLVDGCTADCRLDVRETSLELMLCNPLLFLGVSPKHISIIESLARRIDCRDSELARLYVLIVLRKIRLNESYIMLGVVLGLDPQTVSKIFRDNVPTVSACMAELIFRPSREVIYANLPQAFRYRYFRTDEIIDAFEFEILKPSNAMMQNATYSVYKHFNGLKSVVSATPDGFIVCVTLCFGGRVSDMEICIQCYIECLAEHTVVMADRGFKNIFNKLLRKKCHLIRPPSSKKDTPLSEEDCLETKRVASLRIHIERVIKRLREFAFISPHARLPHSLLPYADCAVRIAAGLVNLYSPLIKV